MVRPDDPHPSRPRSRHTLALLLLLSAPLALPLGACSSQADGPRDPDPADDPAVRASAAPTPDATRPASAAPQDTAPQDTAPTETTVRVDGYTIVARYDHDPRSYTQGLLYHDGALFESTGRNGESRVRQWVPETGKVLMDQKLDYNLFGEGLARWKGTLVQITWKSGVAIVYDVRSLAELARHTYQGEGWGIASDGTHLVMSDGTAKLRFRDPVSFEVVREVEVTYPDPRTGKWLPLMDLNELEVIRGEIWANIYQEELVARIDPDSGRVRGWIDFSGLQAQQGVRDRVQDVLNGIAWDEEHDRIFITGKYWPNLYEIRLAERQ